MKGILGVKVGMTRIFRDDRAVPVTVILAGPCPVVQRRTPEKDGYTALVLGFGTKREKLVAKPQAGFFKKLSSQWIL